MVQNLLEHQAKVGVFDLNPASIATKLVAAAWEVKPAVFDGRFGQRPHKLTVAAFALANGIHLFEDDDPNRIAIMLSLHNIMAELAVNGSLYPLNNLDYFLLKTVVSAFAEPIDTDFNENQTNCKKYRTFEEWYDAYKRAAAEVNPQLMVDENNKSLLDFMEDEPLRRAFRDGLEPEPLAHDFGRAFDISTFGRG